MADHEIDTKVRILANADHPFAGKVGTVTRNWPGHDYYHVSFPDLLDPTDTATFGLRGIQLEKERSGA